MSDHPNRGGRPPLPAGEARSKLLRVRMRDDEHAQLEQDARAAGLSVSEYVRRAIVGAGTPAATPVPVRLPSFTVISEPPQPWPYGALWSGSPVTYTSAPPRTLTHGGYR